VLSVVVVVLLAQIAGTINFIRNESMTYPSCPKHFNGRVCQKKVVQGDNGQW
jgi:hypothetical protein